MIMMAKTMNYLLLNDADLIIFNLRAGLEPINISATSMGQVSDLLGVTKRSLVILLWTGQPKVYGLKCTTININYLAYCFVDLRNDLTLMDLQLLRKSFCLSVIFVVNEYYYWDKVSYHNKDVLELMCQVSVYFKLKPVSAVIT